MLQRLESSSEYILLQSPVETGHWTDALQHPTMSCQVRLSAPSHVLYVRWPKNKIFFQQLLDGHLGAAGEES